MLCFENFVFYDIQAGDNTDQDGDRYPILGT